MGGSGNEANSHHECWPDRAGLAIGKYNVFVLQFLSKLQKKKIRHWKTLGILEKRTLEY